MHRLPYVVMEFVVVLYGTLAQRDGKAVSLDKQCGVVHLRFEQERSLPLSAVFDKVGATAYSQRVGLACLHGQYRH